MSGRKRNQIPTAKLELSTTNEVIRDLERLVARGYFGKNVAEAAEQLVRERLLKMLKEDPELFTRRKPSA